MLLDTARLEAVQRADAAVAGADEGLRNLTLLAAATLGVDFAFVSLVHAEHEALLAVARQDHCLPKTLPVEQSVCRLLVDDGLPLLVADLAAHPVLRDLAEVRLLGLHSYAGTPITDDDGRVLGGFCVGHGQPRAWTPHEADLLRRLADAAATEVRLRVALRELDRLRLAERRRADEHAALHRVAAAVAREEPPDRVLDQVARESMALTRAARASILRFLPDGRANVVSSCSADGDTSPGDPSTCSNALARVRGGRSALSSNGDAPCAAAPIRVRNRLWGALLVTSESTFDEEARTQIEAFADVVELVIVGTESQRAMWELARRDPLTGAANRRAFDERLAQELDPARRSSAPFVLALLDVDHFKQINDEHGHERGDRVLTELVARIEHQLRAQDLLARVGGDEWAVLLPETDGAQAHAVLERVRATVSEVTLGGMAVTVTVGAAVVEDGVTTARDVYRAADAALYQAKRSGRDVVHLADREDLPPTTS